MVEGANRPKNAHSASAAEKQIIINQAVTFSVRLAKQRTRLQAWLINDIENGETNGAFYVYVKRLT